MASLPAHPVDTAFRATRESYLPGAVVGLAGALGVLAGDLLGQVGVTRPDGVDQLRVLVPRAVPALGSHHPVVPLHPPSDDVGDRKSTRLNSSHPSISYAVFCL